MSLRHIALRDFVLVREMDLDLSDGFTVLTGETGAGKSILIDALQLALGARADAMVVREGAVRADISASFDAPAGLSAWLDDAGFDSGEPTVLLRRTIDAQGKSRAWVNGSAATAAQLREIGDRLVDIHGQHAWQSLTRADQTRALLDGYAGLDTTELQGLWQAWRAACGALASAQAAQASLLQERERLTWQIAEIDKLAPGDAEWDELNATHARLANAQALIDAAQLAAAALEDDSGAIDRLDQALRALQAQEAVEPEFRPLVEVLSSALAQAQDTAHDLHNWQRRIDPDPDRLAALDARLAAWLSLARRFKRTPEELPAALAQWRDELAKLDAATDMEALATVESRSREHFMKAALAVSRKRRDAAPKLAKAVTQAMQGLGMQGGRFEVTTETLDPPAAHGVDQIGFLVAGHAGSTPRPIGKVASGGELSRIALAIAVTTSQLGSAATLIFDEVDSGVGGAVAETVGRLMKQLGGDRQVLAVTHLPQVAACADHHLVVSKSIADGAPVSHVAPVQGEQRVAEVARMLGGERLSGTTLAHARELLRS